MEPVAFQHLIPLSHLAQQRHLSGMEHALTVLMVNGGVLKITSVNHAQLDRHLMLT